MNAANRPDLPEAGDRLTRGEQLSSFIDGECPASAADDACQQWRSDADLRCDWHAYHLIGDVLRSDELSSSTTRDAAFVRELRVRLATEPVPVATRRLLAVPPQPRRWVASAAVVAGFMVVGAAVVVLRPDSGAAVTGWGTQATATAPADPGLTRRVGAAAMPASAQTLVIDGQLIRDARLDAYFEAHRGAVGAVPSAVPGGALRSVEILVPQR